MPSLQSPRGALPTAPYTSTWRALTMFSPEAHLSQEPLGLCPLLSNTAWRSFHAVEYTNIPLMFSLDVNPFYERTTVCLPVPTLRNIYVVSSFSNYEHVGFCVNLSFQFTWVNT